MNRINKIEEEVRGAIRIIEKRMKQILFKMMIKVMI